MQPEGPDESFRTRLIEEGPDCVQLLHTVVDGMSLSPGDGYFRSPTASKVCLRAGARAAVIAGISLNQRARTLCLERRSAGG